MKVETEIGGVPSIETVVQEAIARHGSDRDALIPILSEVNAAYGHIPAAAFPVIRKAVHLPSENVFVSEGQLFSVASFYHMFSTKELGKNVIRFCESAPCHVQGGRDLLGTVKAALNVQPGETTPDGKWSLITTSCLGVCAVGPVILVNDDIYGNVTPDQVPGILARYD